MRVAVVSAGTVVSAPVPDRDLPWWSFTKTVIAAAALALVHDGRLQLDAVLPHRRFTLRQLLQHRAGLTDYGVLPAYHEAVARGDAPWSRQELLERTNAERLRYEPGQGWAYSNIGYLHVRELLEKTHGADLGTVLKRRVYHPLGLEGPQLASERADLDHVEMGAARGYDPGWVYHGLVVGRLSDAALLLDHLLAGALLPATLLDEMRRPHVLDWKSDDRPWSKAGYGLGLMVSTFTNGRAAVGHTGGGPGSTIAVFNFPDIAPRRTAAAFALDPDPGPVERAVMDAA